MNVVIAAVQSSSHISGVQRHAVNVARCLLGRPEIETVHFVVAPWQRASLENSALATMSRVKIHVAEVRSSLLDRNLWYYRRFPKLVAQLRADVVHLAFPSLVCGEAFECPVVVTLHDLYPYEIPGNFGFPKVLFNQLILQQCLRNVSAIACVSDATARRMREYTPASVWAKARRIYNCVEPDTTIASSSPVPEWNGQPFLLTVAQHRKNKNIPLLVRALYRLLQDGRIDPRMKLLIVGIPGPETQGIQDLVARLGLGERIAFLQGITEPQLQWCYRHCEAMLAPSETEGFGLPVAEALLAGCRVACSDIAVFREIDQEGRCLFVTLGKNGEERFSQAITRLLQEPIPAPSLLPAFSSGVLAHQYMELYTGLLDGACALQKRCTEGGRMWAEDRQAGGQALERREHGPTAAEG